MFQSVKNFTIVTGVALGVTALPLRRYNIYSVTTSRLKYGHMLYRVSPFKLQARSQPYAMPDEVDRVTRRMNKKDYLLLEEDGLVEANVRFSIADRKTLGVRNKSRQLSLLYKVGKMNLRDMINEVYSDGFRTPFENGNDYGIGLFNQVFTVTLNGASFDVVVYKEDIYDSLTSTRNNGGDYLKVILYRIAQDYSQFMSETVDSFVSPITFARDPENPDKINYAASSGLFAALTPQACFARQGAQVRPNNFERFPVERDAEGRELPNISPMVAAREAGFRRPTEHFLAFIQLPLSFNIMFRRILILPDDVATPGIPDNSNGIIPAGTQIGETIVDGQPQPRVIPPGCKGLDSSLVTFITREQLSYYSHELSSGEIGDFGTLTIRARRTDFTILENPQLLEESRIPESHFLYTFFENERMYERCYISLEYLTEAINKHVLQHVRFCHSKNIVYNNVKYTSFERKNWVSYGRIAQKNPLRPIGSSEIPFKAIIVGTNPNSTVNTNTNVMFTAEFSDSLTTFYRSNRYVTCTAFSSMDQIADPANAKLWQTLEAAFGSEITLSQYPSVILTPAFPRGSVLETTDIVQMRGLVSNAGTQELLP